jgi:3,4-dihydroxy 2-butanone 4-phosphate synthase / GTP cyclohydrolase II
MSSLTLCAERFSDGELILVGDEDNATVFIAAAAQTIKAESLERLQELGRGMVVLALEDRIADRLGLPEPGAGARRQAEMALTAPIDAARGISGGWSLSDRAHTMRLAADPRTGPTDLTIPGHVHPARVGAGHLGVAAATLELARLSQTRRAVALCAIVDQVGTPASIDDARHDQELSRLPVVRTGELRTLLLERQVADDAVSCELPTRDGRFRAIGYAPGNGDEVALALIHGDPAGRRRPLVHIHAACLFGDVFGSLLCNCRVALDSAVTAILDEGAGVILYPKPAATSAAACGRSHSPPDTAAMAGLLRHLGVQKLRLSGGDPIPVSELGAMGLDVSTSRLGSR